MSTYIMLGKIPQSPDERNRLLGKRVEMEEHLSNLELTQVQKRVIEFLIFQKGYAENDIEANKEFKIQLPDTSFNVTADVVLKVGGKSFLVVKCVMSSMESWERHSIAFCRVVEPYQIPYAAVTDSEHARLIEVAGGKVIAEGLDSIPSKHEAGEIVKKTVFCPYPEERTEKEKRILYAFDAIKCSSNSSEPE